LKFQLTVIPPFYLRRGAQPAGWHVRPVPHMLRNLTRRSCLSGKTQEWSEFCGAPRRRAPQVARLGFAQQKPKGRRYQGALSFAYFALSKQRKVSRRRAISGLEKQTHHKKKQEAPKQKAANSTKS